MFRSKKYAENIDFFAIITSNIDFDIFDIQQK